MPSIIINPKYEFNLQSCDRKTQNNRLFHHPSTDVPEDLKCNFVGEDQAAIFPMCRSLLRCVPQRVDPPHFSAMALFSYLQFFLPFLDHSALHQFPLTGRKNRNNGSRLSELLEVSLIFIFILIVPTIAIKTLSCSGHISNVFSYPKMDI